MTIQQAESSNNGNTKILKCYCNHDFQDEQYGRKMRVHNHTLKGYDGRAGWRCTICSNVKSARGEK